MPSGNFEKFLVHRARVRDDPGRSPQIELEPERSFDGPLSGQSVYEQTSGVLRHTGTGLEAGAGAKVARPTRPPTRRHHFTVSLGSSQGTNPRTGGHFSQKCLHKFWDFGRCSCRNFGTGIITLMLSGTSVRSARRRRGAKPLAVAAAAIRVGQDVAASQQPSVAAAALFRLPSACSQLLTMCQ